MRLVAKQMRQSAEKARESKVNVIQEDVAIKRFQFPTPKKMVDGKDFLKFTSVTACSPKQGFKEVIIIDHHIMIIRVIELNHH